MNVQSLETKHVSSDASPADLARLQHDHDALLMKNKKLQRDVEKLSSFLEQLQFDIIAIEESRAWRLGYKIMQWVKSARGQKPGRYAFANIHRVLSVYYHWKKCRD